MSIRFEKKPLQNKHYNIKPVNVVLRLSFHGDGELLVCHRQNYIFLPAPLGKIEIRLYVLLLLLAPLVGGLDKKLSLHASCVIEIGSNNCPRRPHWIRFNQP